MKAISPGFAAVTTTRISLWAESIFLVLLACVLLREGVLPGWHKLNTDFPNYYLVARLLREGYSLDRIYDWVWLQRVKDHWGLDQPLVAFVGLTPLSSLPVAPFAGLPALTAKRFWLLANLLFLFGTVETLRHMTQLNRRRLWILCLLAIIPLETSFHFGQMHILVLFLLTLAYFFRFRKRAIACGICVALAGVLKVYPLLFAFYFLWKRQWREVSSMVFATAALLGVGFLCFGTHVMHIYLAQVLPRSMQGEILDPYGYTSAPAFFHRLFLFEPDLNPSPVWNSPLLYAIVYPLWQAALLLPMFLSIGRRPEDRDTDKIEWSAFLVLLLVLSTMPASYHFVAMILAAALLMDVLLKRQQYGWLATAMLLYILICVQPDSPFAGSGNEFGFLTVLAFARLWLGLLLWLILILYLWREERSPERPGEAGLRSLCLTIAVCAFWLVGFVSYQHHFAHRSEDIHARLRTPIVSLLATDMHARAGGFVSTVMAPWPGYQIVDQDGKAVLPSFETDQLSSATTADRSSVFVELANEKGSRVVLGNSATLWIANAESPAIASDGSTLAYVRENKGRGSLWIDRLGSSAAQTVTSETELVGNPYDIRDVTFASSGYIVFTARVNGKTSIYKVEPGGTPSVLISGKEDVESGAVSPNGQQLIFRRLLHNRWQLVVMDLTSREERQLTFADCNAFAPAWLTGRSVGYATDCERGMGLTALASIDLGR